MATRKYTTDELLRVMRTRSMHGDVESSGSQDTDLINHLNDALMEELIPALMRIREEYFVQTTRIATVAGTQNYRIPKRAIGQKLRIVAYRASSGEAYALVRISPADRYEYETRGQSGDPSWFYLQGNDMMLLPTPGGGELQVDYFFRPGQLVLESEARTIVAVDTTLKTITLSSSPPIGWTTGSRFDIHSAYSGGEVKQSELTANDISGAILTIDQEIDGSVWGTRIPEVGDWFSLEGEAVLPGLPIELHPILAQAGVVKLAEAIGDTEAVGIHTQKLNRMLEVAAVMVDYRSEGNPQKIVTRSPIWSQSGVFY